GLLGLLRDQEGSGAQLGEVGRVPLAAGGNEGAHVGDRGVIAKYRRDGVDEGAFAVCAGAIGENKFVLAGDAGEAVAAISLQKALQLAVPSRDPVEESCP